MMTDQPTSPPQQGGIAQQMVQPDQIASEPSNGASGQTSAEEPKFTQAELNRIIASRVGPLQEKARLYDEQVEKGKTEAQRTSEQMAALQAKVTTFEAIEARRQAATAANLPAAFVDSVTGSTPEEIAASVQKLAGAIASLNGPQTPAPDPSQGQVNQIPQGGSDWLRDSFSNR